jgi:hypothetical protein
MALTAATNAKIAPNLTGTSLLADLVFFHLDPTAL